MKCAHIVLYRLNVGNKTELCGVCQWEDARLEYPRGGKWLDVRGLVDRVYPCLVTVAHALPHPIVEDCYFNFFPHFYLNFLSYLILILHQNLLIYLLPAFIAAPHIIHPPPSPHFMHFKLFHVKNTRYSIHLSERRYLYQIISQIRLVINIQFTSLISKN